MGGSCLRVQLTAGVASLGRRWVSNYIRNLVEQRIGSKPASSIPPWLLLLCSCVPVFLSFVDVLTSLKGGPDKPFSSPSGFWLDGSITTTEKKLEQTFSKRKGLFISHPGGSGACQL